MSSSESPRRLFISFSGGETSAYMTLWLWRNKAREYDEVVVLFANTGQENEATLEFVHRFSQHFGIPVVWIESVVHHGRRKACAHKVVDFHTASREGEPFEEVIRKYGIPNQAYPHCTRDLKLRPMQSYFRSLGWAKLSFDTAVGIRVDEMDRMSPNNGEFRTIYPLVTDAPMTKPDINSFWARQPFRLQLKGYEGNCRWCWKKTLRKQLTIAAENWEWFDFPARMEREHGLAGSNDDGNPRVFFRKNMSAEEIRCQALIGAFDWAEDDSRKYPDDLDGVPLDEAGDCAESCDAFSESTLKALSEEEYDELI